MTKINKLGKSTFVIAILSFLLVAVLAFGGTYAYFSAQSGIASGKVTTGNLNINETITATKTTISSSNEMTIASDVVQPNQVIVDDTFKSTVTGNIAYYTRVKFEVIVTPKADADHKHAAETETNCADYIAKAIDALVITTPDETDNSGWDIGADNSTATTSTAYYYKLEASDPDATDNTTEESFTIKIQIVDFLGRAEAGTAKRCPYWMDAEIEVKISFEVLQAAYLNDADGVIDDGEDFTFDSGAEAEAAWKLALAQTKEEGTETVA